MPCYYPMPAIRVNGCVKVLPRSEEWLSRCRDKSTAPYINDETGEAAECFLVPCGQCIGCRLEHSRQWANRCMLEALDYPEQELWWLTLTYDEDHCPRNVDGAGTLEKTDLQLFIKRLRRHMEYTENIYGIRFYACGEYGSQTWRPHYHVCLFGLPLKDAEISGKNFRGDFFYNSEMLNKLWQNGFIQTSKLTWETCAYTARYCLKKWHVNTKEQYEKLKIAPEYTVMSRRPGISGGYYSQHMPDIYEYDSIVLPAVHGKPMDIRPPRYYDKKLKDDNPELYSKIKDKRQRALELAAQARARLTTLDEDEYLMICAENAANIEKKLPRNL